MAVGTAYKQIRLYDVRQDSRTRRPFASTPEGLLEHRITSLCQVDEHQLVAGDAAGYMYGFDIRTMSRKKDNRTRINLGRYVGPSGSVRQIKKHPTLPLVAAVGLDRMLRIYDSNKRKMVDCVYLKQRLNCVLFSPEGAWGGSKAAFDNYNGSHDFETSQADTIQDYVDSDDASQNGFAAESSDDDDDVSFADVDDDDEGTKETET